MLEAPASDFKTLDALAEEIKKRCDRPVSMLQIAALLESAGITDAVAIGTYQAADVFDLAGQVTEKVWGAQPIFMHGKLVTIVEDPRSVVISDYARGPLGFVPMVLLSSIIMIYQQFGQWTSTQALSMGVAMLGSLLMTSGYVQGASRKGTSYLTQGYINAAREITRLILGQSFFTLVITCVVVGVTMYSFEILPTADIALMVIAFFVLSCIWLVAAVMFMLDLTHWFAVALGIGVVLSYVTLKLSALLPIRPNQTLMLATIFGLFGVVAFGYYMVRRDLNRREAESEVGTQAVVLPPAPQLIVNLAPYFAYGMCYVLLIMSVHIASWIGRLPDGVSRVMAISDVEVGLTVALGGYIMSGGVAEHTIRRFWRRVQYFQARTPQWRPEIFGRTVRKFFYDEQMKFLSTLGVASTIILLLTMVGILVARTRVVNVIPWSGATTIIMLTGLVGYGLMAWGLFNCMFMITFSQPGLAVKSVLVGIVFSLAMGSVISLWWGYQFGVIGMIFGSTAFVIVSIASRNHLLEHADYYYYASF